MYLPTRAENISTKVSSAKYHVLSCKSGCLSQFPTNHHARGRVYIITQIEKNVIELYLTGNDDVSAVCSSLLAISLPLDSSDSSVRSCFENGVDIADAKVKKKVCVQKVPLRTRKKKVQLFVQR